MGADVYADKNSIKEEHLDKDEIIKGGVIIANGLEIAEIVKESDVTMIF